eukprot:1161535-Pelagomonas_calceolata.AAC.4
MPHPLPIQAPRCIGTKCRLSCNVTRLWCHHSAQRTSKGTGSSEGALLFFGLPLDLLPVRVAGPGVAPLPWAASGSSEGCKEQADVHQKEVIMLACSWWAGLVLEQCPQCFGGRAKDGLVA